MILMACILTTIFILMPAIMVELIFQIMQHGMPTVIVVGLCHVLIGGETMSTVSSKEYTKRSRQRKILSSSGLVHLVFGSPVILQVLQALHNMMNYMPMPNYG